MLVRTDSAGATHAFVDGCRDRGVGFSIGLPIDQRVRNALLLAQEEDWEPAVEADGTPRDGTWLIELTDQPGTDIARLELRYRHRAHTENRIRAPKDTGLRNLPCVDVVCNDAWLQLVLTAQDLIAWMQKLCFDGALAIAEPKRLRHRVFHAAATTAHTAAKPSCDSNGPGRGSTTSSPRSPACASRYPAETRALADHGRHPRDARPDTSPNSQRHTRHPHDHLPTRSRPATPSTPPSPTPKPAPTRRLLKGPG